MDRAADAVHYEKIPLMSQLLCFQKKMPKESDETSKEEQNKIDKDDTVETSEEMIRKSSRRNIPSPHRLTPQCKERLDYFTSEIYVSFKSNSVNVAFKH